MASISNLRFAHVEGFISICSDKNDKIFTCGSDGDARVWSDFEDDDPTSYRVGEMATAICVHENTMFVSDENGFINSFELPTGVKIESVCKFTLPVNHMDISANGRYILAGSSDFKLKLIDLDDGNTQTVIGLDDNLTHPFCSVAIDPKLKHIASSSCDGSVKVWAISQPAKAVAVLKILPKFNDISLTRPLSRLQFEPNDGKVLAVPVENGVNLYSSDFWDLKKELKVIATTNEVFSVCAFSNCGKYVAGATMSGRIVVWSLNNDDIMHDENHPKNRTICALLWHPVHEDRLIFGDIDGSVGVFKNLLPIIDTNDKSSPEPYGRGHLIDDEVSCDSNIGALKARYTSQINDFDNDDDIIENNDDFMSKNEKSKPRALSIEKVITGPIWTTKPVQKQFVVNSTPETLDSRYMKWNDVAVIRQYENDGESTIEVEFHDVTLHHAIQLNNIATRFTMADISTQFVAFCSQCDDGKPARLHVIHFGAWDLSKEWTIDLPAGENPSCLAVTVDWLAVASSSNVWLFTSAGFQCKMFALPSQPVTMAACSNKLSIVYSESFDADGSPLYSCLLVENPVKSSGEQVSSFRIPISSQSQLSWFGFTDENTLCACDSTGIVLAYKHGLWVPMFNAQMINGDFFWIISVQESLRQIRGIRCAKSSNRKYPPVTPRPLISTSEFKVPLCDSNTEKSIWEEKLLLANSRSLCRENIGEDDLETIRNELEKTKLQAVLKLFLVACNNDRDCRAYDIARLCDNMTTLSALMNVAHKKGRRILAEKISLLMSNLVDESEPKEPMVSDFAKRQSNLSDLKLSTPCHSQPLFPSEDAPFNKESQIASSVNSTEQDHFSREDIFSANNNLESMANPFKRNSSSFKSAVDSEFVSTKCVFDDEKIISSKKRSSINQKHDGDDTSFDVEPKRQKTLILKKQAKLTFAKKLNEFKTDS